MNSLEFVPSLKNSRTPGDIRTEARAVVERWLRTEVLLEPEPRLEQEVDLARDAVGDLEVDRQRGAAGADRRVARAGRAILVPQKYWLS